FERRVRRVRIGPLDQHSLVLKRTGRLDGGGRGVSGYVQTRNARVARKVRPWERRILDVGRVEPAVVRVVRIEIEPVETAAVALGNRQLVEDPVPAFIAVEVEIDAQFLRRLVENVQRSIEIADE